MRSFPSVSVGQCLLTYCCQCYVRRTTPEHAQALLEAARSKQGAEELELELLEERREEMYWENVPEKVRALSVQRTHAHVHDTRQRDLMAQTPEETLPVFQRSARGSPSATSRVHPKWFGYLNSQESSLQRTTLKYLWKDLITYQGPFLTSTAQQ